MNRVVRTLGRATFFLLMTSCMIALPLLGSMTDVRQRTELQSYMIHDALREITSELSLVRDSIKEDVQRLERDYLLACQNRMRGGGPKDAAILADLDRQKKNLGRLVAQLKRLQSLAEAD